MELAVDEGGELVCELRCDNVGVEGETIHNVDSSSIVVHECFWFQNEFLRASFLGACGSDGRPRVVAIDYC